MHTHDEYFLVVTAIEDTYTAAFGQATCSAPQKVMIELHARRPPEAEDLAAGGIDALHHGADRTVLAGSIHGLEDQQDRVTIARCQHALQFFQRIRRLSPVFPGVPVTARASAGAGLVDPERTVIRHEILRRRRIEHPRPLF